MRHIHFDSRCVLLERLAEKQGRPQRVVWGAGWLAGLASAGKQQQQRDGDAHTSDTAGLPAMSYPGCSPSRPRVGKRSAATGGRSREPRAADSITQRTQSQNAARGNARASERGCRSRSESVGARQVRTSPCSEHCPVPATRCVHAARTAATAPDAARVSQQCTERAAEVRSEGGRLWIQGAGEGSKTCVHTHARLAPRPTARVHIQRQR